LLESADAAKVNGIDGPPGLLRYIVAAVKHLIGICVLAAIASSVMFGQTAAVPAEWIGVWTLSPQDSRFGSVWGPGIPDGLTVTSQTLKISATSSHIKIVGDTRTPEFAILHEESDVSLDGKETVLSPGVTISFKRLDETSFDIIVQGNNKEIGNQVGENRFVFSVDGKTLTETKTHTQREVVPEGNDQTKGAAIRTSVSILVFHRTS
jgi:hypothetical protein